MRSVFIIGAAKSGTTAVWSWLKRHPEVATHPVKEPNYFALNDKPKVCHGAELDVNYAASFALTHEAYQAWRASAEIELSSTYICDASPSYLYFPGTAAKIRTAYPDAKIICVLRNPVDRAFSQYMHHVRDGYETAASFAEALAAEEGRIANNWWWGFHYRRAGLYAAQWREYAEAFPADALLCLTYDQIEDAPAECWRKILHFLEIGPGEPLDLAARVNEASSLNAVPAFGLLNTWIRHPSRMRQMVKGFVPPSVRQAIKSAMVTANLKPAPSLCEPLRRKLLAEYAADIRETEDWTGLKLSNWRESG